MKRRLTALSKRMDRHGLLGTGGAMLAARTVSVVTGIGLAVLLARSLGAEGYGVYIFALTLALMLSMPVQMGLPTLLMRQIAIYRSQQDRARLAGIVRWSAGFVALSLMTVSLAAGGYLLLNDGPEGDTAGTALYSLTLLLVGILCVMQIAAAILHGFERVFRSSLPDGVMRPVLLLALVLAFDLAVELTPTLAMGLHAAAAAIALAWASIMVVRHCRLSPAGMAAPVQFETRAWLASLLPLALITGAAMINSKLDLFMLGMLSTSEAVGNYALALQVAGLVLVAQTIVNAMIGPKVARLYAAEESQARLQELITQACRLSAMAALACLTAIIVFGDPLIAILVGADFPDAAGIAAIIGFGFLFSAAMGPTALILNMSGHEHITARIIVCSALLNGVLNSVLIPRFGAHGAAVASFITVVTIQSAQACVVKRLTGLDSTIGRAGASRLRSAMTARRYKSSSEQCM